jgi:mercuric ion transport protein
MGRVADRRQWAESRSDAQTMAKSNMRLTDQSFAAVGAATGFGGLFAGAACCVLPLALASIGIGAGGLARLSPFHAPLSILALLAVAAGWFFYVRRRLACRADASCERPARSTPVILTVATAMVVASAAMPLIEAPLMRLFA